MTSVALEDPDINLAALTRRVDDGETIVVTRDGKPVANLVPIDGRAVSISKPARRFRALPELCGSQGSSLPISTIRCRKTF